MATKNIGIVTLRLRGTWVVSQALRVEVGSWVTSNNDPWIKSFLLVFQGTELDRWEIFVFVLRENPNWNLVLAK